jgi:hypothetical protein
MPAAQQLHCRRPTEIARIEIEPHPRYCRRQIPLIPTVPTVSGVLSLVYETELPPPLTLMATVLRHCFVHAHGSA